MSDQTSDILARLSPDLQSLIPGDPACQTALSLAANALPEPIFNHSLRVYLLARRLANKEGSDWTQSEKLPLLFAACICHDFGASDHYNGHQRFEIEGANAASEHCASHGISAENCHKVWCAIALHTSAGIAERIDPFTRLVRVAVKLDFSPATQDTYGAQVYAAEIERLLPRLNVEKVLADAVVKQATKIPEKVDGVTWPPDSEKHPKASWPGILLRAHAENPNYEGVNPAF